MEVWRGVDLSVAKDFAQVLQTSSNPCTLWRRCDPAARVAWSNVERYATRQGYGQSLRRLERFVSMPLDVIFCRQCARSRPNFLATVKRLAATYPHDLRLVELDCMAACDDVPAAMIETEYFPRVNPRDFEQEVLQRLRAIQAVTRE